MSPDPSGLYYADPTNPQSLNLYSYVLNNPLKFIDPSGLECIWDDGSFDSADDAQTGSHAGCSAAGGTYADPHAFSQLNAGDWSSQANSNLANVATALNSSSTSMTVNANGSGSVDQTGFNLSSFGLTLYKNDSSWGGDTSLALSTAVAQRTKFVHCFQQATGKNGVSLALDGAGFVPGEGIAAAGVQYGVATASAVNSASQGDTFGRNMGAAGEVVSVVSAVNSLGPETWGKAIPFAGTVVNGVATAHDLSGTSKDYQTCMSHP